MNSYPVGNLVQISVCFTEVDGNTPVDPTTVTLLVRTPDQTLDSYVYGTSAIIRDAIGKYHFDLPNLEFGYYYYRWEGSGNVIAANNGQFNSVPSPFGSL